MAGPLQCFYGYPSGEIFLRFERFFDLPSPVRTHLGISPMKCQYCHESAGFLKRVCVPCAKVVTILERAGGEVGLAGLVDIFIAEGLTREQVDLVLDARIGDLPTWRDRLTSNMTNALMRNLGMPGRQSPEDVMRVRTAMRTGGGAGTWQAGEEPPEGH